MVLKTFSVQAAVTAENSESIKKRRTHEFTVATLHAGQCYAIIRCIDARSSLSLFRQRDRSISSARLKREARFPAESRPAGLGLVIERVVQPRKLRRRHARFEARQRKRMK